MHMMRSLAETRGTKATHRFLLFQPCSFPCMLLKKIEVKTTSGKPSRLSMSSLFSLIAFFSTSFIELPFSHRIKKNKKGLCVARYKI